MALISKRRRGAGDALRPTGNPPRTASTAKSVHPRGPRYPGGKLERRIVRSKRDRFTRSLAEEFASNAEQRRKQGKRRRTTGAVKRKRRPDLMVAPPESTP